MDGDHTPQNQPLQVAHEQNTRLQLMIETTARLIARSRKLLARLARGEKAPS
jgi:hypothetical protein